MNSSRCLNKPNPPNPFYNEGCLSQDKLCWLLWRDEGLCTCTMTLQTAVSMLL